MRRSLLLSLFLHGPLFSNPALIEEAFVTYSTENYFPLMEVLLDSAKEFSSRPVVAFGVNEEIPFSQETYPFLIKRRIDVAIPDIAPEERGAQTHSAFALTLMLIKPTILLESNVRNGVYVDADLILNKGCDALFGYCAQVEETPLSPTYPHEMGVPDELMAAMGVTKKTMNCVHNPIVVFSEQCLPFLKEWESADKTYGYLPFDITDESIYNALLWKQGSTSSLRICDPYYPLHRDYIWGGNVNAIQNGYGAAIGKIDFYSFHGCKIPAFSKRILRFLLEKHNSADSPNATFPQ